THCWPGLRRQGCRGTRRRYRRGGMGQRRRPRCHTRRHARRVCCHSSSSGGASSKKPSMEEASAVGVPFVPAFSALVGVGQLKEGEWVIVSGAAGSVGQAATAIAHAKGAHVVALIKDADARWVSESGAVRATAQSDLGDLNRVVREATNGKGADLALNGVGSSVFGALLEALAVEGRQVVYSAAGGREFPLDLSTLYRNQFAIF